MSKKSVKMLQRARSLIENGWCKNFEAKDKKGNCVFYDDPRAAQFCIVGACYKAEVSEGHMDTLRAFTPHGVIGAFNDRRATSKKDVLELFDWAIGVEEAGGLS